MYPSGADWRSRLSSSTGERKSTVSVIPPDAKTYSVFVGVMIRETNPIGVVDVVSPVGWPRKTKVAPSIRAIPVGPVTLPVQKVGQTALGLSACDHVLT